MPIRRFCFLGWIALIVLNAAVMGRPTGPIRYWRSGDNGTTASSRFAPTRPEDVEALRIRVGEGSARIEMKEERRLELRPGRFAPRRPGEESLVVDPIRSARLTGENGSRRFEPTRPEVASRGGFYNEDLQTVYNGYRRLEGENVSADFRAAEPWVRDLEGTAKRKVKKALWKKLVTAPVKVAFKVGPKAVVKVAVGSWIPFL